MGSKYLIAAFVSGLLSFSPAKAETGKLETIDIKPLWNLPAELEQRLVGVYFRNEDGSETKRFHGWFYDDRHIIVNWHGFRDPVDGSGRSQMASAPLSDFAKYSDLSRHYVKDVSGKRYDLTLGYCQSPERDLAVIVASSPNNDISGKTSLGNVQEGQEIGIILITDGSIELRYGEVKQKSKGEWVKNFDSRTHYFINVERTTINGWAGNSGAIGFSGEKIVGMVSFGTLVEEDESVRKNLGLTNANNIEFLLEHCGPHMELKKQE